MGLLLLGEAQHEAGDDEEGEPVAEDNPLTRIPFFNSERRARRKAIVARQRGEHGS